MVRIPAGRFGMGSDDATRADEHPAHIEEVAAFELDATLVTRKAFVRFVDATGYITTAEREGFGMASREGMEDWAWERVPHGSFRAPFIEETLGREAFLREDASVVMVSFEDASAYCTHHGKRLPTEVEWEYAMRAGAEGTRYPWGDSPLREGKLGLNFWQGESHLHNTLEDGFRYVSPVRAFPPNGWGIFDPVGNVWQWTATVYDPLAYRRVRARRPEHVARERASLPPDTPRGEERVLRGGSWWCGACTCEGYGLSYRGHANPRAAFNNNGFRCAR